MTLAATEFLRRFFLHVLPRGFVRIRHFGLLSNRFRSQRLPLARTLLALDPAVQFHHPRQLLRRSSLHSGTARNVADPCASFEDSLPPSYLC
jgi:hypothetical protein